MDSRTKKKVWRYRWVFQPFKPPSPLKTWTPLRIRGCMPSFLLAAVNCAHSFIYAASEHRLSFMAWVNGLMALLGCAVSLAESKIPRMALLRESRHLIWKEPVTASSLLATNDASFNFFKSFIAFSWNHSLKSCMILPVEMRYLLYKVSAHFKIAVDMTNSWYQKKIPL